MKTLVIMMVMMVATAFAGTKEIDGYLGRKLGDKISKKAKSGVNYRYIYKEQKKDCNITTFANEKREIIMIVATLRFPRSYQYENTVKGYAEMVSKCTREYGSGTGDTTATFRGRESYKIIKNGRELQINKKGPYVSLVFQTIAKEK